MMERNFMRVGIFPRPKEVKFIMFALKWALADRNLEDQKALAIALAQMSSDVRLIISVLVQALTDVEAKQREAERRREAQEEEIKHQVKQRSYNQKKANIQSNTNVRNPGQGCRWSIVMLKTGLLVGIGWVGLTTCQSRLSEIRHEMVTTEAMKGHEAKWQQEMVRHRNSAKKHRDEVREREERHRAAARERKERRRAAAREREERHRAAARERKERRRAAARKREERRRKSSRKRRETKQAREAQRHLRELQRVLRHRLK
jgi:hypothetical protein